MSFVTRGYYAAKLALKANAPTLMVAGGVVSMGVSVITASRQTLKLEEVLEKHVKTLDRVTEGAMLDLPGYGQEVAQGDRFRVYSKTGVDCAKLYVVPAVFFVGGAALVFGGHRMLLKRNATLALAFTTLYDQFQTYRERVRTEAGGEWDELFLNGFEKKTFVDPETGEKETVNTRDWDETRNDPYNRVFEQGATDKWQPDLSANKFWILNQQKYAQELLNRRGYVYLSEVYQALGFPETDISRVAGWKQYTDPATGNKVTPVIDFGVDKPHPDDWMYTKDHGVYLDINCQGLIIGGKIQKIIENAR